MGEVPSQTLPDGLPCIHKYIYFNSHSKYIYRLIFFSFDSRAASDEIGQKVRALCGCRGQSAGDLEGVNHVASGEPNLPAFPLDQPCAQSAAETSPVLRPDQSEQPLPY